MKAQKALLIATAMMATAQAKTLEIGGRSLAIPDPEGYVEVTPEMPALYGVTRKIVDPDNETLAYYIPAGMADAAKAGEALPEMKYMVLKVKGNTQFVTMGNAEFGNLVAGVRSTNQMITDELKSEMGDSYDTSKVVEMRGLVVFPPHRESTTAFSNSMLINQVALGGKGEAKVMSATKSYANVGGKVLLLYAFGAENDLDWTRTAADAWTDAVLAVNPEPPVDVIEESSGGINEGLLGEGGLQAGLIGAVIGGVLAFFVVSKKNRRKA